MKSLHRANNRFAKTDYQLKVLNGKAETDQSFELFSDKLKAIDLFPLKPTKLTVFQVNLGKMCNQVCQHCHVDAGPDRKEIMTQKTMNLCLEAIKKSEVTTVDLTGGAPEMNPNFRWFVEEIHKINLDIKIIVRCNLTIILANKKYHDLPDFYKKHKIEVVSSLPYFSEKRTDSQRGDGVFEKSIKALQMLNSIGYGTGNSDLILNLVYNPTGAFLPGPQVGLEMDFKRTLKRKFNVEFNSLFAITNIPISRFLEYLVRSGNYIQYMEKLVNAYNPIAAESVMCRDSISISWDGYLYDCDFNQMLDMKVNGQSPKHLKDWNYDILNNRDVVVNQHCYGCTAGAGSSCGGETVN